MVNKCVVTNCSTDYKTGQKKASFDFDEDQELKRKRNFVNRKDWLCIDHFEEKFLKRGKKYQLLCCGMYIQSVTLTIPRKSATKRNI